MQFRLFFNFYAFIAVSILLLMLLLCVCVQCAGQPVSDPRDRQRGQLYFQPFRLTRLCRWAELKTIFL